MARGKKPARGGTRADPDPAANPSVAAASGPPVDILADDALGPDHARVRRWVVFSDLHLNRRTSRVCVDVLEAVHREAEARDAGIAFLGDFWHARGAIPVEPLIEALNAIRSWTRPCVMIPGNHDQVTAGGEVHALTPLAAANPSRVKIISQADGVEKRAVAAVQARRVRRQERGGGGVEYCPNRGGRLCGRGTRRLLPRRRRRRVDERIVPGGDGLDPSLFSRKRTPETSGYRCTPATTTSRTP